MATAVDDDDEELEEKLAPQDVVVCVGIGSTRLVVEKVGSQISAVPQLSVDAPFSAVLDTSEG